MKLIDQQYPSKRTYLQTDEGQLHVRRFGNPSGKSVVMLHWTPGSGALVAHAAHALGKRGYDVWAPDMFGFGASDHPEPSSWTQARHGKALAQGLQNAGLKRVILHGGHMGGEVAIETSLAAPDLVDRLILDGIASNWTVPVRTEILSQFAFDPPDYDANGAPLAWSWTWTHGLWNAWVPTLKIDEAWQSTLHQAMIDFLQTGLLGGCMRVSFGNYDAVAGLEKITHPVLALTADSDTLRDQYPTTVSAIQNVKGYVFSGVHPCHRPDGGDDYAAVLAAYIEDKPQRWLRKGDDLAPKKSLNTYKEEEAAKQ